jgi:hypothetical protein
MRWLNGFSKAWRLLNHPCDSSTCKDANGDKLGVLGPATTIDRMTCSVTL